MIFVVIMTTQKVFKNSLHSHKGEIMDGPLLRVAKASLDTIQWIGQDVYSKRLSYGQRSQNLETAAAQ